jgi:hypothetical protein
MRTFLRLQYEKPDELPLEFGHDVRTSKSFVEEFSGKARFTRSLLRTPRFDVL